MGAMMGALWSTGVEANLNMSVFLHKLFEFDFTSSMSDLVHATANALNGNTVHAMSGNSKTTHTQESNQNILSGGGAQVLILVLLAGLAFFTNNIFRLILSHFSKMFRLLLSRPISSIVLLISCLLMFKGPSMIGMLGDGGMTPNISATDEPDVGLVLGSSADVPALVTSLVSLVDKDRRAELVERSIQDSSVQEFVGTNRVLSKTSAKITAARMILGDALNDNKAVSNALDRLEERVETARESHTADLQKTRETLRPAAIQKIKKIVTEARNVLHDEHVDDASLLERLKISLGASTIPEHNVSEKTRNKVLAALRELNPRLEETPNSDAELKHLNSTQLAELEKRSSQIWADALKDKKFGGANTKLAALYEQHNKVADAMFLLTSNVTAAEGETATLLGKLKTKNIEAHAHELAKDFSLQDVAERTSEKQRLLEKARAHLEELERKLNHYTWWNWGWRQNQNMYTNDITRKNNEIKMTTEKIKEYEDTIEQLSKVMKDGFSDQKYMESSKAKAQAQHDYDLQVNKTAKLKAGSGESKPDANGCETVKTLVQTKQNEEMAGFGLDWLTNASNCLIKTIKTESGGLSKQEMQINQAVVTEMKKSTEAFKLKLETSSAVPFFKDVADEVKLATQSIGDTTKLSSMEKALTRLTNSLHGHMSKGRNKLAAADFFMALDVYAAIDQMLPPPAVRAVNENAINLKKADSASHRIASHAEHEDL